MALPINLLLTFLSSLFMTISLFHHGWANYDQTQVLDYTGLVQEISYENPHGMAKIKHDHKTWTVVLAPPSRMKARGLTEKMIRRNDSVRVVGYPHKKIEDEMRAERIYIGDKKIELR